MQLNIREVVIGHATTVRHHHQYIHHLLPLLYIQIKIVMTARFNVLQLNANGIGNKLTELGVVMENNKVKVALIQDSKRTPKYRNPCIQNYTTVRKERPHGQGGGLFIFIHRSVTFSKQPSAAESLYDPHLEELAIESEIGNT